MNNQIETTDPMALPSDTFVAKHAYKMKGADDNSSITIAIDKNDKLVYRQFGKSISIHEGVMHRFVLNEKTRPFSKVMIEALKAFADSLKDLPRYSPLMTWISIEADFPDCFSIGETIDDVCDAADSAGVILSSQIKNSVFDFLVKSDKVPCNQKPKHILDAKKSGDILNVFYATGGKCGLFEYHRTSISCEDFKRVTGIDLGGTRK